MRDTRLKNPLVIKRGDTFELTIRWEDEMGLPISTLGYEAHMQLRSNVEGPVVVEFSTSNGGITLADGDIHIEGSAQEMEKINSNGVFDLQLTSSTGRVKTILNGNYVVSLDVTRKPWEL